ncbi:MAG: hypothetical protein R3B90_00730 [Planctomycetaceae bacterium]
MLRFFWGAGALPLMSLFRISWGGTMAVRRDLFQEEELRNRIRHAFSEDTTIGQFAKERGELIRFEPSLVIVNREDIRLAGMFQFDKRQLLAVKMQHSSWPAFFLHGVLNIVGGLYPVLRCFDRVHWVADLLYVLFFLAVWWTNLGAGLAIRRIISRRNEKLGDWDLNRVMWGAIAALSLPLVHGAALIAAAFARTVLWRGVLYKLHGQTPLLVQRDLWEERPPQIRDTVEST